MHCMFPVCRIHAILTEGGQREHIIGGSIGYSKYLLLLPIILLPDEERKVMDKHTATCRISGKEWTVTSGCSTNCSFVCPPAIKFSLSFLRHSRDLFDKALYHTVLQVGVQRSLIVHAKVGCLGMRLVHVNVLETWPDPHETCAHTLHLPGKDTWLTHHGTTLDGIPSLEDARVASCLSGSRGLTRGYSRQLGSCCHLSSPFITVFWLWCQSEKKQEWMVANMQLSHYWQGATTAKQNMLLFLHLKLNITNKFDTKLPVKPCTIKPKEAKHHTHPRCCYVQA